MTSRAVSTLLLAALSTLAMGGCKSKPEPAASESPAPLPPPPPPVASAAPTPSAEPAPPPVDVKTAPFGASAKAAGVSGTLSVKPHPVVVCDKQGGITTVSWTLTGTKYAEVHVGSPDGQLFAATNKAGSSKTGPWVVPGTTFFLQNRASDLPLTLENTLARLTVDTVSSPCP